MSSKKYRRQYGGMGNSSTRGKWYRSRHGIIFGVCQGLADWRELPVAPVRLITFIFILVTGAFPGLLTYFGLAIFLPLEPQGNGHSENGERNDSNGTRSSRTWKGDKEKDWDQRFYDREK